MVNRQSLRRPKFTINGAFVFSERMFPVAPTQPMTIYGKTKLYGFEKFLDLQSFQVRNVLNLRYAGFLSWT